MSKKRISRVNIGGVKLEIDFDEYREELTERCDESILQTFAEEDYWNIALPWLANTDKEKEAFMSAFKDKEKNRAETVYGKKFINKEYELSIITRASFLKEFNSNNVGNITRLARFGELISGLIKKSQAQPESLPTNSEDERKPHVIFRNISELLRDGLPDRKYGELDSPKGKIWQAFCECHSESKPLRLPTTSEVLKKDGLKPGMKKSVEKEKRELMKDLGLGGLRE